MRRTVILLVSVVVACGWASNKRTLVPTHAFAERFPLVDSMIVAEPKDNPIVRVSGVAVGEDGGIAISDASEGRVTLVGANGAFRRIVGRKGAGPGELEQPRTLAFDRGGRLHVLDVATRAIDVFDSAGAFVRRVGLDGAVYVTDFGLGPQQSYVTVTPDPSQGKDVVVVFDSLGRRTASMLPVADVRPRGQPPIPEWRNMKQFQVAVVGDTAYVTCTLSDTLWRVVLATKAVTATAFQFEGQVMPTVPRSPIQTRQQLAEWGGSFHVATVLRAAEGQPVTWNEVMGVLNYGDPNVLVVRDPTGILSAYRGAPPIIASRAGVLYSLLSARDTASKGIVIGRHRAG